MRVPVPVRTSRTLYHGREKLSLFEITSTPKHRSRRFPRHFEIKVSNLEIICDVKPTTPRLVMNINTFI